MSALPPSEQAVLLSVSLAINSIRDKVDLLKTINDQIIPLFATDNTGLFIINEAENYHYDLTVQHPEIDNSAPNEKLSENWSAARILHRGSAIAAIYDELKKSDSPIVFDFADLFSNYPHPFAEVILNAGFQETMGALLRVRGEPFGILFFNSRQKGFFSGKDFPLFQAVADQVAVAVSNILANEAILEREREKTALLAISKAIATIRDKKDLLEVIIDKIKPLFDFNDCGLFVFDAERQHLEDLTVSLPTISPSEANQLLADSDSAIFPYPGSVFEPFFERLRAAGGPLIHDYQADKLPNWETYVQAPILDQVGYAESMFCLLKTGGEEIGAFAINSLQKGHFCPKQFHLFQAISDQLSVAVANILANEEILEREREKSLQLAVTTALTSQLAWTDKFQRVAEEIGLFVPWDMASFIFPDRPALSMRWRKADDGSLEFISYKQKCRELQTTPLELRALFDAIKPLYGQPTIYAGEAFDRLREQYPVVELTYQHWHIRSRLDLPIPVQGTTPVMLILTSRQVQSYTETHLALLQRLVSPMALALENSFSFEELEQRNAEKNRQLALNQVLVGIKQSTPLYAAIARELNEVAPFDTMSVRVIRDQELICYVILDKKEGYFTDTSERVRAEYSTLETLEVQDAANHPGQPTIYVGEDFDQQCTQQSLYQIRRDRFGFRSSLVIPLPMKEAPLAVLILNSQTPYAFTNQDLNQLRPLIPPVALAVENLLAFEEIKTLKKRLEQEKTYLVEEIKTTHNFEEIIGTSPLLGQVFRQVSQVALTDTTVLLTGESGTGKELIARALHNRSPRKDNVLVKINCAALPASLIESELFGHEKGAFTGAIEKRVGKFELANGGTLFLDEIGELPLELQTKLLRVLQEKEFERLGSNKLLKTDVRVIAATNRNLSQEVTEGRFRLDLFYRLSVFPIHLPPLRERREDIPMLATYFAGKFSKKMGKSYRGIQEPTMQELLAYQWPGNIRELENIMEQAVILNDGQRGLEWVRPLLFTGTNPVNNTHTPTSLPTLKTTEASQIHHTFDTIQQEQRALERDRILAVLRGTNGRIRGEGGAAQQLGLKPTTLEARINRLGIKHDHRSLRWS